MPIELIRSDSLIAAARAVRDRLAERAETERAAEEKAKREAAATKSLLGKDHWHDRHRAEQRQRAADAILAALTHGENGNG